MPLKGSDHPFESLSLSWLPASLRAFVHDITYDEVHAALLGLIGIFAGAGWFFGVRGAVQGFTVAILTLAFGLRAAPDNIPIAGRLVRREPWYFTTVYVLSAVGAFWSLQVFL